MIAGGYAKATPEYFCGELPTYQVLNWEAKLAKKGLYALNVIF